MSSSAARTIDPGVVRLLVEREEKRLEGQTPESAKLYRTAKTNLAGDVSNSYQAREPYPIYYTEGRGSKIRIVDGLELSDFHDAYGCMV